MENKIITIHHDCDGVLRNFIDYAMMVLYKVHPELKKYELPRGKSTGWGFNGMFDPKVAKKAEELCNTVFFENPKTSYDIFRNAKPLVSVDEWKNHVSILKNKIPNCRIVISTHQETTAARIATIEWLNENIDNVYDDLIFTKEKQLFNGDYLLDDKPKMIERFHIPFQKIGVLNITRENEYYFRQKKTVKFPTAKNLKEFRDIIFENMKMVETINDKINKYFGNK